jgi:haloacetate dehalogenase
MSNSLNTLNYMRYSSSDRVSIAYKAINTGTSKPPLLLLHGHPQTHMIWHKLVDELADQFTLILPDLRGYGQSSKPSGNADHSNYSKRVMAQDLVGLMQLLGHAQFAVCAHDRGARVTHRMMLDHPQVVTRAMLLDIAPTLAMYEQTTREFAQAYWHWFYLIQPAPLPETLLASSPDTYMQATMGSRHAGMGPFTPEALASYRLGMHTPDALQAAHAVCEDYRAAATIDLEHDRASIAAGQRVQQPLRVLWGAKGVVQRCFRPLDEWRKVASDVSGQSLDCGHYIPEEAPEPLLAEILTFFK